MIACIVAQIAAMSLVDYATNSIARLVEREDSALGLARFVEYPPSKGRLGFPRCLFEKPFPENEKFWLRGIDFSCVSPWNDSCGTQRAGTLISRRHIIFAKHYPLWKGVRILFVDGEGDVCACSIKDTKAIEGNDIMIGLLDYEVTPGIRPAKILPHDYEKYIGDGRGLPIVTFNQREQVVLSQLNGISTKSVCNTAASDEKWKPFGGKMVVGDSGNPAFLLVGDDVILLYCLLNGGAGHGPSVFHCRSDIQRAMDDLCPGYKLEEFDFAAKLKQISAICPVGKR